MLYIDVYNELICRIYAQKLHKGDRLPSFHQLSAEFGVSDNTVRTALRMLHEQGYVRCAERKATRVVFDANDPATRRRIQHGLYLHRAGVLDCFFARALLIPAFVPICAQRLTDAERALLRERRAILAGAGARHSVTYAQDFSRLLISKMNNARLLFFVNGTNISVSAPFALCDADAPQTAARFQRIAQAYIALVDALLERRDAELSARMRTLHRVVFDVVSEQLDQLPPVDGIGARVIDHPISYSYDHRYVEAASHLLIRIMNGQYPPGSLLPPEARLCRAFQLSKQSMKKALRFLNQLGVITTENGVGSVVCANPGAIRESPATIALVRAHLYDVFDALQLLTVPMRDVIGHAFANTDLQKTLCDQRRRNLYTLENHSTLALTNTVVDAIRSPALSDLYGSIKQGLLWGTILLTPEQTTVLQPRYYAAFCDVLAQAEHPAVFIERMCGLCEQLFEIYRTSCVLHGLPAPQSVLDALIL